MIKLNEMIPGMRAKAEDINENFNMLLNYCKELDNKITNIQTLQQENARLREVIKKIIKEVDDKGFRGCEDEWTSTCDYEISLNDIKDIATEALQQKGEE